jgi:Mn2+/Fe2+ NRAMP family transporter
MAKEHDDVSTPVAPPTNAWGILRRIGPGLIIAGSIVGSGELIATTKTGAEAGFWLLWLVLIGCIIKVFVQVELGRYAISSGESTMSAMNQLPGPRLKRRGNWVIWFWFIMFCASVAQLGGIVGGVGQALSISAPLTTYARDYNRIAKQETTLTVNAAELRQSLAIEAAGGDSPAIDPNSSSFQATLRLLKNQYATAEYHFERLMDLPDEPLEDLEEDEDESESNSEKEAFDRLAIPEPLSLSDRRNDVRTLMQYLETAIGYLEGYQDSFETESSDDIEVLPVDPNRPNLGGGNRQTPTGDADRQWVEDHLRTLQNQLLNLEALGELSAAVRALRSDFQSTLEQQNGESSEQSEKKAGELRALVKEEEKRLFKGYDFDEQLGFSSGLDLTTVYATYSQETEMTPPNDDKYWAAIVAIVTAVILANGRFGLIQSFSTAMVACFTGITIVNLVLLNQNPSWAVSFQDIVDGMRFRLPPGDADGGSALSTALKTFGIIGVGASELVAYPYWCLEKGYARFTGPREDSESWLQRAQGWMRVMRVDAWGSMVIYTFATMAFYLLGASVLGRTGLSPESHNLVRYLAVMYEPVFGKTTEVLFLFGCFAVLYSTFFVANAGNARVFSDSLRVLGFIPISQKSYEFAVRFFCGFFPILCLVIYIYFPHPAYLVLLSGLMQAVMLPMLAATALFLRYRRIDPRLAPTRAWDIFLWISSLGMLVAGCWAAWSEISKLF